MVKFITYKDVSTEVVTVLRESGYEVFYVASADTDATPASVCQQANVGAFILLTGNEELVKSILTENRIQSGLIQLVHGSATPLEEAAFLLRAIQKNEQELSFAYHRLESDKLKKVKQLQGA